MTATALRKDGVNVDLAPVEDVPAGPADFIEQQHRAFSTNRFKVTLDGAAFAAGRCVTPSRQLTGTNGSRLRPTRSAPTTSWVSKSCNAAAW